MAAVPQPQLDDDCREIGAEAVWTLSSAKPGNGVVQLRDDQTETFWQSDGSQPHTVTIQFQRKQPVKMICIYSDFKLDESYTPAKVAVFTGNTSHDLTEVLVQDVEEPSGWITLKLPQQVSSAGVASCLRASVLQIRVLASHQNGRDTHLRQIKVFGPRAVTAGVEPFTSSEFQQLASIR